MTKKTPLFYLVLLFFCNFVAVSLAVEGSVGGSEGNQSPGERGDGVGEEQKRSEEVNAAYQTIRTYLGGVRQDFCMLCFVAASNPDAVEQMGEDAPVQLANMLQRMNNVMSVRHADIDITQDMKMVECANLLRTYLQRHISDLIYMIPHGSEMDPFPNTDPYIRLLALERFRDYFGFDTQREYDCETDLFQREMSFQRTRRRG